MKRYVSSPLVRIIAALAVLILSIQLLFLWFYTNIDGYFYWAIGHYFKTGIYPFISPFIYARPTTISPPLYGVVLAGIGMLPRADVIMRAAQLSMVGLTAVLLFRMLSRIVSAQTVALLCLLYILFPATIIFANSMMTEIPAQAAMTVLVYLVTRYISTKRRTYLTWTLLLSAGMVLLKYQFIVMYISVLAAVIWSAGRTIRFKKTAVPIVASILFLVGWISINYIITGVVGLSDTKKMPFYTNAVWSGHLYPPDTDPAVITLRQFVPKTADRYAEYWDLQDYILPHVNRDWTQIDTLLGNVGLAAVRAHPLEYLMNGPKIFLSTLTRTAPWWHNVGTFGIRDQTQPLYCDKLDSIRFCEPLLRLPWSYSIWNAYVYWATLFYNRIMPAIFLVIFLPCLLISLADSHSPGRIYALIYLLNLIPISYLAMPESRYLIPYYPLMMMISVYGLRSIYSLVRRVSARTSTSTK